jgi:hypothetical protein
MNNTFGLSLGLAKAAGTIVPNALKRAHANRNVVDVKNVQFGVAETVMTSV